jgi:hypothetical protein
MLGGDPRGYALLGRRTLCGVREGEAASREKEKASVGRGKAELFPLQGGSVRLNLKRSLFPFLKTFPITEFVMLQGKASLILNLKVSSFVYLGIGKKEMMQSWIGPGEDRSEVLRTEID